MNPERLGLNLSLLFLRMMSKKVIFLILALLFPATIFVFLKLFGRNEFQVPVLHENSVPDVNAKCNFSYNIPYRIADSVVSSLDPNRNDSVYVVNFDRRFDEALSRISVEFKNDPVAVFTSSDMEKGPEAPVLRECVFLMQADTSIAVFDNRKRIRGYYDGGDRDEVDRMIVEIKIILKQY